MNDAALKLMSEDSEDGDKPEALSPKPNTLNPK